MPGTIEALHLSYFVQALKNLRPSEIARPTATASTPVLVQVTHVALNYVDILYAQGKHQNNRALVKPPFTLGMEFSGIVIEAPTQSHPESLKIGDAVYGAVGTGAFAQVVAAGADSLRRIPPAWTAREAAGVASSFPVSLGALRRARLKPGETVLVHAAAGGLGVAACQIAVACGATVIATVGSDAKAAVLRQLVGVEHVINYSTPGWEDRVLELTGGKANGGVDVVFDPVGLVKESIRVAKYRGRIIVVGFAGREGNLEAIAVNRILLKSVEVIGYRYGEDGRRISGEHGAIWRELEALFEDKNIRPIVYHERYKGLREIPRAMKAMLDRNVYGKAVIELTPGLSASPKI